MLAIQRKPLFKNKFFLGPLAVIAGFIITVGLIRTTATNDTPVQQTVEPTGLSTSITPILGSESETSSESGGKSSNDVNSQGGQEAKWASPSSTNAPKHESQPPKAMNTNPSNTAPSTNAGAEASPAPSSTAPIVTLPEAAPVSLVP